MRSRTRAFTLIELLTVVAIIGVLAAILIATVSQIRDSARRSTCVSNLRQIGAAFPLYAADNKGLYPAPRQATYPYPGDSSYTASNPAPGVNPSGDNWQVELSRYVLRDQKYIWDVKDAYGNTNITHCPTYDLFFNKDVKLSSQTTTSTAGYGMNLNMNVGGANYGGGTWGLENTRRFRAAAITYPSKTIIVGDSSEFYINVAGTWNVAANYPDGYNNGAPKRHGPVANYLFADGHVETLTPEAAIVAAAYRN